MTTPTYKAVRGADGSLTIRDVPIFVECQRGDHDFDVTWLKAAVATAMSAAREGYLPPLHVRHHVGPGAAVQAAGFFKVTGTRRIIFKGEPKIAVMADLIVTDAGVGSDILMKRLPYRSVEILDAANPKINSLALLDHESPYLELPMLMVSSDEADPAAPTPPAYPAVMCKQPTWPLAESVFFSRGTGGVLVYQERIAMAADDKKAPPAEDQMDAEKKDKLPTKAEKKAPPGARASPTSGGDNGQGGPKDDAATSASQGEGNGDQQIGQGNGGDEPEATTNFAEMVVQAIDSGTATIGDVAAIMAALDRYKAQRTASINPDAMAGPARAAVPGGESMSATDKTKDPAGTPAPATTTTMTAAPTGDPVAMAALAGKVAALEGTLAERDATQKRKDDVAAALKKLEKRPLGANPEATFTAFHTAHGPAAFAAYIDQMVATFGSIPTASTAAADNFTNTQAPEVAMAYQEFGTEAVNQAARFSAEWKIQKDAGFMRMAEDRYVAINMGRLEKPVVLKKKAVAV